MIGIYKITNLKNLKTYIGQSINIEIRWFSHRSITKNPKTQIGKAIKFGGLENFKFEVLEECLKEELDGKERFYIGFYNSYKDGYNGTLGGDNSSNVSGELNPRAKLKEEDVFKIRNDFNNHIPFRDSYEKFKDKISKRGFQKVWYFETWKNICPNYNNEENKKWHNTKSKSLAINPNAIFSIEEILEIRKYKTDGKNRFEMYEKYKQRCCFDTFEQIWYKMSYKTVE